MSKAIYSYALASLAAVKDALGITSSDDDNLLTRQINAVTDYIESYCGRRFKDTTYTDEYYDGDGETDLILKQFPITDTAEISITFVSDDVETAVDNDDLEFYNDEGMIYYPRWPRGRKNIKITYSAGYATIPADLAQACIELVATIHNRRKTGGAKSESIGDYSITYGDLEASPLAQKVIDFYRNQNL